MSGEKILITTSSFGKVDENTLKLLLDEGFEVTLNPYGTKLTIDQSLELLPGHIGLIAGTEKLTSEIFDANPQLKYICRLGVGMDSVDEVAAKERGIVVENTPSAHVEGVAEMCLAGIIDSLRKISASHHKMKNGVWKKQMGSLLRGKNVGLIGLGQVSKRLVELLKPFNVKVTATDLFWDEKFADENDITRSDLDTICSSSDVISIHIPMNASNRHIIGEQQFNLMSDNVVFVNTGRGGLVDEVALENFLNSNPLSYGFIDTFEEEPYSGSLINCDNILLTPHIGSQAREVRINMETECAHNTIKYFKNG